MFCILLNCLIYSLIDYGLQIWGVVCSSKLDNMQCKIDILLKCYLYPSLAALFKKSNWRLGQYSKLNKLRVINNSIDKNFLLERFNILSIKERIKLSSLSELYKCWYYKNTTKDLKDRLVISGNKRNSNENNPIRFIVKSFRTTQYQKSIIYRWINLFNHLPSTLRLYNPSFNSFQANLIKLIICERRNIYI